MDNFKGSIAQKNVQFPIEVVIEPLAGENYSRAMIFIPISKKEDYLKGIDSVEAGKLYTLTSSNYGDLTGDLLKKIPACIFVFVKTWQAGIS